MKHTGGQKGEKDNFVLCFLTPRDPPADPGSPSLDSTETETCWLSLAEHKAEDKC